MDKTPTEAGTYWARQLAYGIGGCEILTLPFRAKVVAGVPNSRGDKLLVETGLKSSHHASLNCYRWGEPTAAEMRTIKSLCGTNS